MKHAFLTLLFIAMLFMTACGVQPVSGQIATQAAPTLAFPPLDTQTAAVPTIAVQPTAQPSAPVAATPAGNTAVVNVSQLNIRVGPGVNYNVEKTLDQGAAVTLLGKSSDGNWYEVQLQDGSGGWVFSAYVITSANLANLPVMPAPIIVPTATAAPTLASAGATALPSGSIPLTGATAVPIVVPATTNPLPVVVAIASNQAQVTLSRFPVNKSVIATLGARGTNESVRITGTTTDANGSASFGFPMPFSWPDGTPLTQQNLFLTATTTDGSFSRTLNFPFFSGR
jgi:uncharacterized protein YgiM (DUF1202 family)